MPNSRGASNDSIYRNTVYPVGVERFRSSAERSKGIRSNREVPRFGTSTRGFARDSERRAGSSDSRGIASRATVHRPSRALTVESEPRGDPGLAPPIQRCGAVARERSVRPSPHDARITRRTPTGWVEGRLRSTAGPIGVRRLRTALGTNVVRRRRYYELRGYGRVGRVGSSSRRGGRLRRWRPGEGRVGRGTPCPRFRVGEGRERRNLIRSEPPVPPPSENRTDERAHPTLPFAGELREVARRGGRRPFEGVRGRVADDRPSARTTFRVSAPRTETSPTDPASGPFARSVLRYGPVGPLDRPRSNFSPSDREVSLTRSGRRTRPTVVAPDGSTRGVTTRHRTDDPRSKAD